MLAIPAAVAQEVADDLVEAGVRIIFNYSEALLDTPPEVTVHTSNPAVELLHALYFTSRNVLDIDLNARSVFELD